MAAGKFISYLRVSTDKQGRSGLGLEAQREAVSSWLNGGCWQLLQEFIEIESGKKNDRPQLREALAGCKATGATLVVAKLDRLARNVAFVSALMESGVDFLAVDFPTANRLTIHILAAVAEHEAQAISDRTRAALARAKARGTKLGTNNLTEAGTVKGHQVAEQVRKAQADQFAQDRYPQIVRLQKEGLSLNAIARQLNTEGILGARGKAGSWSPAGVSRVINRMETGKQ